MTPASGLSPAQALWAEVYAQYLVTGDPVPFAIKILRTTLWAVQEQILRDTWTYRDVAVKSCHASGKTFVAAVTALSWVLLHPPGSAIVIITSSDWSQVENTIFPTIHALIGAADIDLGSHVNKLQIAVPGGSYILGKSTDNPTGFHGYHAPYLLVIRDEFSGIDAQIVQSMAGMRAGGDVHFLDLMNPVVSAGPAVDRFADPGVTTITIDAFDSPNLTAPDGIPLHILDTPADNSPRHDPDWAHNVLNADHDETVMFGPRTGPFAGLVNPIFVKEQYELAIRQFGSLKPEADWWPKVRGLFPTETDEQLIHRGWVAAANTAATTPSPTDPYTPPATRGRDAQGQITVGIDVAGPGENETAICIRDGYRVIYEAAFPDTDPYARIVHIVGPPRPDLTLHLDATGIGHGLAAALHRASYRVVALNAAARPFDPIRFVNYKAEAYWRLRELFQDGLIVGPIAPKTAEQLLSVRWSQGDLPGMGHNARRQIQIESKADARRRGVQSPDRAEAMMLCFAGSPTPPHTRELRIESQGDGGRLDIEQAFSTPPFASGFTSDAPPPTAYAERAVTSLPVGVRAPTTDDPAQRPRAMRSWLQKTHSRAQHIAPLPPTPSTTYWNSDGTLQAQPRPTRTGRPQWQAPEDRPQPIQPQPVIRDPYP